MNELVKVDEVDIDRVVIMGDLSPLTPEQRLRYYTRMCHSLHLNPLTQPFAYIRLNGQLKLYAKRDCTDQLRLLRGISIEIVDRKITEGLLSVHVRATDKDGRKDEDFGVVPINGAGLAGPDGANLIMKAVTKAKRRVTLSICGLGLLDESEIATVPDAEYVEIDDAGEIRIPESPKPKRRKGFEPGSDRKTSYAAKKDGTDEAFKELHKELADLTDAVSCGEFWKKNSKAIFELPSRWFDILKEEYVSKMEDFGLTVEVGEQQ